VNFPPATLISDDWPQIRRKGFRLNHKKPRKLTPEKAVYFFKGKTGAFLQMQNSFSLCVK
jgi:hypothetical protein